jgi:hypothetical protein
MQAAPHEMFPPGDAAPGVASGQHLQPAALFYIDLICSLLRRTFCNMSSSVEPILHIAFPED